MPELYADDFDAPVQHAGEAPQHGYRGDAENAIGVGTPTGLTIAISREAGSRGGSIARRAGEKLGWEVYSQEMLEYGAPNAALRQDLMDKLSPAAHEWIEEHLQQLLKVGAVSRQPNVLEMAQLVLALGAQGNVILLGRGAGYLLPRRSTLHVRFVAPLSDRVAYMAQWLRLTEDEAAEQVRKRDHRRTEYLAMHFHRKPNDVHLFDMVLNTSLLGEERCADVVAAAAKAKMSAIVGMD